jgi:hypothetical protein
VDLHQYTDAVKLTATALSHARAGNWRQAGADVQAMHHRYGRDGIQVLLLGRLPTAGHRGVDCNAPDAARRKSGQRACRPAHHVFHRLRRAGWGRKGTYHPRQEMRLLLVPGQPRRRDWCRCSRWSPRSLCLGTRRFGC